MKYQTKPIVVDAVQWFKDGDDSRVVDGKIVTTLFGCITIEPSNWIVYYPSTDLTDIYSDKGFRELFEKDDSIKVEI